MLYRILNGKQFLLYWVSYSFLVRFLFDPSEYKFWCPNQVFPTNRLFQEVWIAHWLLQIWGSIGWSVLGQLSKNTWIHSFILWKHHLILELLNLAFLRYKTLLFNCKILYYRLAFSSDLEFSFFIKIATFSLMSTDLISLTSLWF